MNRRLALIIAVFALASARRAAAQDVSIGYQGLPYKTASESKTGITLAEGVLLHVGAGAEAGWDSNVFYSSSSGNIPLVSSAILRFGAFGELTNATRSGAAGTVTYDLRAGLTYRRYTASDVAAYANAFMPTAGLSLGTGTGAWNFLLADTFVRLEDPPYLGVGGSMPLGPISRDNNIASVQGQWSPGGGRIVTTLRYTNTIDVFEQNSGYAYASSLAHQFMVDVAWKWLPKTALFVQLNQGYVTYLNEATKKVPSYPFHAYAGLRGLVTPKITALIALGYVNAFYSQGPSTSGFWGSTYVDAQAIFTPSLLSRLTLGYHQDFVNSVISNFYYSYAVYGSWVQQIAGRVSADLSARLNHADYEGLLFEAPGNQQRVDNTVTAGATIDYFVHSWIYLGVGYSLVANLSDFHVGANPTAMPPVPGIPVDYVKHQVFARLGLTY
jgi:hypothetical protein